MAEPVIAVRDLVRTYRVRPRRPGLLGALRDLVSVDYQEVRALDGVSFDLHPGEVLGWIGPNGAGKSTTVKCLTGILKPDGGTVRVVGLDPWRDRTRHVHHIGVVFGQRTQLWWDLAVREAFDLLAAVFRVPPDTYQRRLDELIALLDLEPLLAKPVRELSLGQRVRCDFAAALLHGPRVVLLDEPTIGLDVAVKQRIRDFIRGLADRGTAVLLTTHDLGDVERLCDRVALLAGGRIVFEGTSSELQSSLGGRRTLEVHAAAPVNDALLEALSARVGGSLERQGADRFALRFAHGERLGERVAAVLDAVDVLDLRVHEPTMEEVVAAFYEDRR